MHQHVRVEKAESGHPEGELRLWVKDKHVVLGKADAEDLVKEMAGVYAEAEAPAPVPVEAPVEVPPEAPPVETPAEAPPAA